MPEQDGDHLQDLLPQGIQETDDHTGHQGTCCYIIDLERRGVDQRPKFQTAAHLASWSGLKPRNDESNKKIKSRRITHGNIYLRKTIIECAWGATRTRDCFFSRFSFRQTQVRKKNKLKVLVAVARKLLIAVWHVLHDETDYKDFGTANDCDTSAAVNNG